LTVWEAFEALKGYVDSSDPDSSLPNLEHMLQTAEGIRAAGHPDWFQLVGLLHDMGKLQYLWGKKEDGQEGTADGDQWALGGDTWVVGCRIPDSVVFPEFNALNPDMGDERYNTEYGVYEPHCGIANLQFAWGHDEYLYRMLVHNKSTIPPEGLAMIRYHSCYPWHKEKEYQHLMAEGDQEMLDWVLEFNKFDLYTKADVRPDVEKLWPYYQTLIDKYLPGKLQW
jgi:inositol oxygenase